MIELSKEKSLDLVLNKQEEIYCTAHKGIPEPKISWILIDTLLVNSYSKIENILDLIIADKPNSIFEIEKFKFKNSSSNFYSNRLKLNATMSNLNKTLICVVEHPLLEEPLYKSVNIELKCKVYLL